MRGMESRSDIVTIASALWVAGYVAIALRHVALYDLGFSSQEIRSGAVMVALAMAAMLAIDFFASKLGNT
jgi:ABC-type proline/glycine betaine transport system substrate-binding protein